MLVFRCNDRYPLGAVCMRRIIELKGSCSSWQLWNFWPRFRCQGTETKARQNEVTSYQRVWECVCRNGWIWWAGLEVEPRIRGCWGTSEPHNSAASSIFYKQKQFT